MAQKLGQVGSSETDEPGFSWKTLKMDLGSERASEEGRGERQERSIQVSWVHDEKAENLEETNSKRGASLGDGE
jgi:hypothetical protein